MMYFKAWLFFIVVTFALWLLVAAPVGIAVAVSLGLLDVDREDARIVAVALGWILGLGTSFICYNWSVKLFVLPKLR